MRRTSKPKSHWIMLLLALAMAGAVAFVWTRSMKRTSKHLLASAQARYEASSDMSAVLREVNLAIELAEQNGGAAGKEDLAEALSFRSDVYRDRATYDLALADLERIYSDLRPEDDTIMLRMVEIDVRSGHYSTAAERVLAFLAIKPGHSSGWAQLARARRFEAEALLAQFADDFGRNLPSEIARHAVELVNRAAAMDRDALARAAVLRELEQLYAKNEQEGFEALNQALDRATALFAEARRHFGQSLHYYVSERAFRGYIELVDFSGDTTAVSDFGSALLAHESARRSSATMEILAEAFHEQGRDLIASAVLDLLIATQNQVSSPFLTKWARILYDGKLWTKLPQAAQELQVRAGPGSYGANERRAAEFYLGMTNNGLGQVSKSMEPLQRFLTSTGNPPFAGAEAESLFVLAEGARVEGQVNDELRFLRAAVIQAPERSADAWSRLAELGGRLAAPMVEVEHALANALRLAPERAAELIPRWQEAGQRALFESGIDIELTRQTLARSDLAYPSGPVTSYELYQLATGHLRDNRPAFASETCRRLLVDYPHFPPALDLLIDALEEIGDVPRLAERLLERVETGGPDPALVSTLNDLPPRTLNGAQVVRLMQADPRGTGLVQLTRDLPDAEAKFLAIHGLMRGSSEELDSDGKVLSARILNGLELWAQTIAVLEDFPADHPLYSRALRLKIEAALALGRKDVLSATLLEVAAADVLDPKEVLPVVDQLLRRGQWPAAMIPLGRLDSRVETRSGDVTLRLALAHMIAGQHGEAREALDRAEAYRKDGGPELGHVLLTIQEREWSRLPEVVREALDSDFRPTAFQLAVLSALEERLAEANGLVAEARDADPEDPLWYLLGSAVENLATGNLVPHPSYGPGIGAETQRTLRGKAGRSADPRDTLAILLALGVPEWIQWALGELGTAEPGTLWPMYLNAVCLQRLGDDYNAARFLRLLTGTFPQFAPGWHLLEELELKRLGRPDHPLMLDLRSARRVALGEEKGDMSERLLATAMRKFENGTPEDLAEAEERATLALKARDLHPARLLLARIHAARGEVEAALSRFGNYFDREDPELAVTAVPEYLRLAEQAAEAGLLSQAARTANLGALALRFPRHPLIPLELARLDIAALPDRPTVGLGRAFQRLDRFRESIGGTALEDLERGTTRAWVSFLLEIEPKRAEQLVRSELERKPGSSELWILIGETLEAQGLRDEALAHYGRLLDMLPSAEALRRVAHIKAQLGMRHGEVKSLIRRIQQLEGTNNFDMDLSFIEALSLVNSGPAFLAQGQEILAELYARRAEATGRVSPLEIAERYGFTLVQHAVHDDWRLAVKVLEEVLEQLPPGAESDLVWSMLGLAKKIPEPPPPPEPTEGGDVPGSGATDATGAANTTGAAQGTGEPARDEVAADQRTAAEPVLAGGGR